jgi:hypothetical protein
MKERAKEVLSGLSRVLHRYRFRILLASLLLVLAVEPLAEQASQFEPLFGIALSLVILAGLAAMQHERVLLGIAILLGAPVLLARWIAALLPTAPESAVAVLIPVLFFAFFVVFLLRAVVWADEVTSDVIAGALSVYVLMGMTWSLLYQSIFLISPAAFNVSSAIAAAGPVGRMDFLYYSFITLATVGYGDITPVAPLAQSFAYAEAVIGVLYVAVLVARLVSAYQRPPHPPR